MSLIDVAMVIMILGLLLTPMITIYNSWKIKRSMGETQKNQMAINKAIADYYFLNGNYPCPADLDLGSDAADYGREDCAGTIGAGGISVGGVPFATLLIPTDIALDGFSNKFTYTVTTSLTVDTSYNPNGGNIAIYNKDCLTGVLNSLPNQANAHFVILSHGENGLGARTANGTPRQACSGASFEGENCNNDANFHDKTCAVSDVIGSADYYDDLIFYTWTPPTRIWAESPEPGGDILTSVNKVGINNLDPQFNLDVIGNIRATDTLANGICDLGDPANPATAADCFDPSLIGGNEDDMDCTDDGEGATVMSGIGGSKAKCEVNHNLPTTDCSSVGGYIVGIGPGGTVLCGS